MVAILAAGASPASIVTYQFSGVLTGLSLPSPAFLGEAFSGFLTYDNGVQPTSCTPPLCDFDNVASTVFTLGDFTFRGDGLHATTIRSPYPAGFPGFSGPNDLLFLGGATTTFVFGDSTQRAFASSLALPADLSETVFPANALGFTSGPNGPIIGAFGHITLTAVPEPVYVWITGCGAAAMLALRLRRGGGRRRDRGSAGTP